MKTKLTKIWGISLVVGMLVMLIGAAIPVSAAELGWSPVGTPNPLSQQIQADSNVDALAVAPDGTTMFAYDDQAAATTLATTALVKGTTYTSLTVADSTGFKVGAVYVETEGFTCTQIVNGTTLAVKSQAAAAAHATGVSVTSRGVLYKSTDGGVKWTTTNIGGTLEGEAVLALAISPDYATDSTVVAATSGAGTAAKVFRSINGGKTFGSVGALSLDTDETITSVAVSTHYLGGTAILVGTSDVSAGGSVFKFTTSSLAWTNLTPGTDLSITVDALAVAFSPNHTTDAEILAVVKDETGTHTKLITQFGTDDWGLGVEVATVITGKAATGAVIAFADDYEWSSNNRVLVGTTGTDADDVFRVHGALPGGTSLAYDLNVNGTTTETEVYSIAAKGNIAEADVLVGQVGSTTVKRAHDPTTSTITWRGSTKSPTGDSTAPNTLVLWSPTTGDAYAATTGDNTADGSAFSRSTDGGVTWNQLALIDVSGTATLPVVDAFTNLSLVDSAVVDANTMYLLMWDNINGTGTDFEAGDYSMVFKSTNGGTSWEQVWAHRSTSTEGISILVPSPNYATDETLFAAQDDTRLWKTTNGGETFIGLTSPKAITAIGVVDKDTYYTGHIGEVYKSGRWVSATGAADTVKSFAIAADGTIFIGNSDGDVQQSTDDAGKFTTLGASNQLGTTKDIIVVLHPDYATNSTIYAGSTDADEGVERWIVGTSTVWKQLDDDGGTLICKGLAVSADGTLYAASNAAQGGIRRMVSPLAPASAAALGLESVTADLASTAKLENLAVGSGSNVAYAIASAMTAGSYGYPYRLLAFEDTLAVSPELSAPKDGTASPGTGIDLSWKAISAPFDLWYRYQIASDASFANIIVGSSGTTNTRGTAISVASGTLTAGSKYWWRVYVDNVDSNAAAYGGLLSKKSAYWTFTPKLTATGTTSYTTAPAPGAIDVSLRPVFQWASVPGATSYEMEMADNPFFANASVKKPLTHTVWTWDTDLEYSTTYYWRARAVKSGKGILTNYSSWSEASFTTMAKPAPPAPPAAPPQITVQPAPPAPPAVVTIPPAAPSPVTPAIIWAIIIIGAVLVIAVIVLIVRTRRVP